VYGDRRAPDAGGDDESRQAKRQAVEVFKLTGLSHDGVRKIGDEHFSPCRQRADRGPSERANDASANILTHLPADPFSLIASHLDGQSIKPMLLTCRDWRAHWSSPGFWEELCKSHFPWLLHMIACMPQPQPPLRQLYSRQVQRKAYRKAATSLSDYSYVMGIFGEKNGPPLVAKYGQLGELYRNKGGFAVDLWSLGPHGALDAGEPAWASKIVSNYRTPDGDFDSAGWDASEGRRIASKLQVMIFITRPGDGKSFCLYDGVVSQDPSTGSMDIESSLDADKEEDLFSLTFAEKGLPNAQSFTRVITRHKGLKLEPILSLRVQDYLHPLSEPELFLKITMPSMEFRRPGVPCDGVFATDDDLVRYFLNFAPFGVLANK
jgi:hypothetical protein